MKIILLVIIFILVGTNVLFKLLLDFYFNFIISLCEEVKRAGEFVPIQETLELTKEKVKIGTYKHVSIKEVFSTVLKVK